MIDYIEPLTLALIPGFLLLDFFIQKRLYNTTRHWRLRAILVTTAIILFSGEVAAFWGSVFGEAHLLNPGHLGLWGVIPGILVYEFFHYWYRRSTHEWNWLWRAGHQMHHSAESLDAFGTNYLHRFDAAMFSTLASLVLFPLLGLSLEAGVVTALFLTFNAMFQHANIGTPHWLGYLIQRPESHNIHHGQGIHRYNYADLPLWDMLFGTFNNLRALTAVDCGFYKGSSARLVDMLAGRDVSRPATTSHSGDVPVMQRTA